jgi:hypothetical protein
MLFIWSLLQIASEPTPKINGTTCTFTPDEDCTVTYACIESFTIKDYDFQLMDYTAKQSQFVVMALKYKEDIGTKVHKLDTEYFDGKTME